MLKFSDGNGSKNNELTMAITRLKNNQAKIC